MQEIARGVVEVAEQAARDGASAAEVLHELRRLSLDDFGVLMISLPNPGFPMISRTLPAMASVDTQKSWTGSFGIELLKQTLAFTKQLEVNVVRLQGAPLQGSTILDFGCGYGRFVRMLYYYTDPSNIWAVDAWDRSLAKCEEAGLLGNFVKSESIPKNLPVSGTTFAHGFAFSVFTHLRQSVARACLAAIRSSMQPGALFMATIRPVEFWQYLDQQRGTNLAPELVAAHRRHGFAYLPHRGSEGETYGDLSCVPEFMEQPGWELLGYDSTLLDTFQTSVLLRAN